MILALTAHACLRFFVVWQRKSVVFLSLVASVSAFQAGGFFAPTSRGLELRSVQRAVSAPRAAGRKPTALQVITFLSRFLTTLRLLALRGRSASEDWCSKRFMANPETSKPQTLQILNPNPLHLTRQRRCSQTRHALSPCVHVSIQRTMKHTTCTRMCAHFFREAHMIRVQSLVFP